MRFSGDVFRIRATAIVILLCVSAFAHADLDYNADFYLRSYPFSGGLIGNAGYGFLLWGTQDNKSPMYGYIRPQATFATAGYYNLAGAALDVFPISIFGFRLGGEGIENDRDYTPYACDIYECRGRTYRTYLQSEFSFGSGPFFGQLKWRRDRLTRSNPDHRVYIDSIAGLAFDTEGDGQTSWRAIVGMKLNEIWSVSAAYTYLQADNTRTISRFPFALVRYKMAPYSVGLAAGMWSSTLKPDAPSIMLLASWNGKPGVALAP